MLKQFLFLMLNIASFSYGQTITKTITKSQCNVPTPTSISKPSSGCLKLINDFRKSQNVPLLRLIPSKKQCVNKQAFLDYNSNDFHSNFGMCKEAAQCECKGFKTVKECINAYIAEGPGGGHYEILRSKKYTHVTCGEHKFATNKFFYVQNFYNSKQNKPTQTTKYPVHTSTIAISPPPITNTNDCVALINQFRQSLGLSKLVSASQSQIQCANNSALNDKSRGFHNSFGQCSERAQCECNGQTTIKQCIDAYISEGPGGGHYEILKGPYTSVACGTDGGRFYTQNFY